MASTDGDPSEISLGDARLLAQMYREWQAFKQSGGGTLVGTANDGRLQLATARGVVRPKDKTAVSGKPNVWKYTVDVLALPYGKLLGTEPPAMNGTRTVYGHNFLEDDGSDTENDLAGLEFTFNALPGFLGGLSLKQGVFHSFNAVDEGFAGRSVLSLDFAPDLGVVRPRLSLNGGGVYGHGVQDGFVVGPELALDINLFGGFTLRPKVAYDYQFRNPDWDEGILWAGLDLGIRF